jgi:hypothetical protein
MRQRIAIPAAVLATWLIAGPGGAAGQSITLAQAVREFNEKTKEDA